jgi:hypothetical protein
MPINPTLVYNTTATNNVTDVLKASLEPDSFGFIAVTHSSTKLTTSSTVKVALEGSYNSGADWFAIETMAPTDADYVNTTGDVPSWFRVVPVVPDMRVRIVNGGGLTYKIWIAE